MRTKAASVAIVCAIVVAGVVFFGGLSIGPATPVFPRPLETITGILFPAGPEGTMVTEELAHTSIPWKRTGAGHQLFLGGEVLPETADIVELGIRRGEFWLDAERVPVRHRILDALAQPDSGWHVLHGRTETVFLPPGNSDRYDSLDAFLESPPRDGVIGLYGNTALPCANNNSCTVAPFRVADDPLRFAAIYARYIPREAVETSTMIDLTFPLTNVYQQPDGSFDLLFFAQRKNGGEIRYTVRNFSGKIEPALPTTQELLIRLRAFLRKQLLRPSSPP